MLKPRIFISAVSQELGQTRQLAAQILTRLGYDAVWQEVFGTEAGDLRQMLREKINDCDGLVHLVGNAYGSEPPEPDPEFGRISYTQFEFRYAQKCGKKTWVIFAEDGYPADKPLEQLDLPANSDHSKAAVFQSNRRKLQARWRKRLRAESHLWHEAKSTTEFELKFERLNDAFATLRQSFVSWQKRLIQILVGVALLALVSIALGIYLIRRQQDVPQRVNNVVGEKIDVAHQKTNETIEATATKTNSAIESAVSKAVTTTEQNLKTIADEKARMNEIANAKKTPIEVWLNRMLDEPVRSLEFPGDNPLTDLLEQISIHFTLTYGAGAGGRQIDFALTFLPDKIALDDESVVLEDVIIEDIELDGVTLRSALNIILGQTDPALAFVIKDEVIYITTKDSLSNAVDEPFPATPNQGQGTGFF